MSNNIFLDFNNKITQLNFLMSIIFVHKLLNLFYEFIAILLRNKYHKT